MTYCWSIVVLRGLWLFGNLFLFTLASYILSVKLLPILYSLNTTLTVLTILLSNRNNGVDVKQFVSWNLWHIVLLRRHEVWNIFVLRIIVLWHVIVVLRSLLFFENLFLFILTRGFLSAKLLLTLYSLKHVPYNTYNYLLWTEITGLL